MINQIGVALSSRQLPDPRISEIIDDAARICGSQTDSEAVLFAQKFFYVLDSMKQTVKMTTGIGMLLLLVSRLDSTFKKLLQSFFCFRKTLWKWLRAHCSLSSLSSLSFSLQFTPPTSECCRMSRFLTPLCPWSQWARKAHLIRFQKRPKSWGLSFWKADWLEKLQTNPSFWFIWWGALWRISFQRNRASFQVLGWISTQ